MNLPVWRTKAAYFRIFIDAATLKVICILAMNQRQLRYFRIFIDAATLKACAQFRVLAMRVPNFRIFIDAATLKVIDQNRRVICHISFPHLYRCGHIEGSMEVNHSSSRRIYFRIFIDAATLKAGFPPVMRVALRNISASL